MNFENILLIILIFYVGWHLYDILTLRRKNIPKLRLISKKTGQVIELNVFDEKGQPILQSISAEEAFQSLAKDMFSRIVYAFTSGDIEKLKALVSPKVLDAFEQAIKVRSKNNQHMDFTLLGFKDVKLLKTGSDKVRQVAFTTEQINLVKDEKGDVISGDPMYVTTVSEIWTFEQQADNSWVLSATKQGAENVA